MTPSTPPASAQFPERGRQGESSPVLGGSPVAHAIAWTVVLGVAVGVVGLIYAACEGLAYLGVMQ